MPFDKKNKNTKAKKPKPKPSNNIKKILGTTGVVGTTALVAYLTKQNIDLKKSIDGLKKELEHYKALDGKLSFSFFGKPKPSVERQIKEMDIQILRKNDLIAELEKKEKEYGLVNNQLKDRLESCEKVYKEVLESLKQRNKELAQVPKTPGWASKLMDKKRTSV